MTVKVRGSQKTSHLFEAHAMLGAPPARPDLFEMCLEGPVQHIRDQEWARAGSTLDPSAPAC